MFLCSLSIHRHFQTSVINFLSVNAVSQSRSAHVLSLLGLNFWLDLIRTRAALTCVAICGKDLWAVICAETCSQVSLGPGSQDV